MKLTVKDRKELHHLIHDRWGKVFGQWKDNKDIPDKITNYLDYLQRLHNKIDTIGGEYNGTK